ncbi:MAG: hypothetical protein NT138_16795 [Planctomycetales bacterium]|jgi:hypothetical protein|nr:hypothetical protein [Planctomycetales bacterium]
MFFNDMNTKVRVAANVLSGRKDLLEKANLKRKWSIRQNQIRLPHPA